NRVGDEYCAVPIIVPGVAIHALISHGEAMVAGTQSQSQRGGIVVIGLKTRTVIRGVIMRQLGGQAQAFTQFCGVSETQEMTLPEFVSLGGIKSSRQCIVERIG